MLGANTVLQLQKAGPCRRSCQRGLSSPHPRFSSWRLSLLQRVISPVRLHPKDKEVLEGKFNLKIWEGGGRAGVGNDLSYCFDTRIDIMELNTRSACKECA